MTVLLGVVATIVFLAWTFTVVRVGAVAEARFADACLRSCRCGRSCARGWRHAGQHLCHHLWWPGR